MTVMNMLLSIGEYNQSIQYAQQAAPDCRFAAADDAGRYEAAQTTSLKE